MTQLPIDVPHRPALGRADFLLSDCNAAALGWIERWPDWPAPALVLHGPARSGKSHLAHLWQERSGGVLVAGDTLVRAEPDALAAHRAVAVDDAERAPERALLHLCNCVNEAGASLLLVARAGPATWPIALPDLASRLRAMPTVAIAPPDPGLLAAVLAQHFDARQVAAQPPSCHRLPRVADGTIVRRRRQAGRAARPDSAWRRAPDRLGAGPPGAGRSRRSARLLEATAAAAR
jgi:hypothetical protein